MNKKGDKLARQRSEDSRESAPQDSPDLKGRFDEPIGLVRERENFSERLIKIRLTQVTGRQIVSTVIQ